MKAIKRDYLNTDMIPVYLMGLTLGLIFAW